ncbi:MAG TPA: HD domain-containing phosphohydrolase [Fimbriimonas sp.]|nr:HD domain-containing phosphohydrolase [Fimbriimonas sp.]
MAKLFLACEEGHRLSGLEESLRNAGAACLHCCVDFLSAPEEYRSFEPDVAIIDLSSPVGEGIALLEQFRAIDGPETHVPAVIVLDGLTVVTRQQALEAGVTDIVDRGTEYSEIVLRIRNVARSHRYYRQMRRQKNWLEDAVRNRTRQLEAARREVIERLALAAEYRDDDTGEHTRRVGKLSGLIAEAMGEDPIYVGSLEAAALLHDLGKIGIPDSLLLKTGPLTDQERLEMQQHTVMGAAILADCAEPVMLMACEIAITHHERWDGKGYPNGFQGEEIPLSGRIVSVADAYDAMVSERPYKTPMRRIDAIEEIVSCSGKQFDPRVVRAFLQVQQNDIVLQEIEGAKRPEPVLD